jgi:hypothetical protein
LCQRPTTRRREEVEAQMTRCMRRTSAGVVLGVACLVSSRPALAQSAPNFAKLIQKHSTVFVVDNNGTEFVGRLLRVEPSSLTISRSEGEQSFEADRVTEIFRRGDSVWSGAKVGAVVGAILGGLATKDGGCGALLDPYKPCSVGEYAANMAATAGLGAGIGAGIDALFRGRTRIYPGKHGPVWPAVSVLPDASLNHAGIVVSARW